MTDSDRREQTIRAYERWISSQQWAWFATLKITSGVPTDASANQRFNDWIAEVRRVDGGDSFRWVRVMEKGHSGSNRHFHVLVGGLRNQRKEAAARWSYLGGDAVVERYDPSRAGILYMLKSADASGNLDIDFKLPFGVRAIKNAPREIRPAVREIADEHDKSLFRVSNISSHTSPAELWHLFERFGTVFDVRLRTDPKQTVGFLEMAAGDAEEVLGHCDGRRWKGRRLRVENARPDSW